MFLKRLSITGLIMFFQKAEKVSVSYQSPRSFISILIGSSNSLNLSFTKTSRMDDFLKFTDSSITGYLIKFSMKSKFTDRA